MRNDDSDYVRDLERALRNAEKEIKCLEARIREQDQILTEYNDQVGNAIWHQEVIGCGCCKPHHGH